LGKDICFFSQAVTVEARIVAAKRVGGTPVLPGGCFQPVTIRSLPRGPSLIVPTLCVGMQSRDAPRPFQSRTRSVR